MAEIKKISASQITLYEGCSMAYFLKHIKHEKVPANLRTVFGSSIHYLLERFYKVNYKSPDSFANYWKFYFNKILSGENLKGKQRENLTFSEYPLKKGVLKIGNHINMGFNPVVNFFNYMKLGESILKNFYIRHISEKKCENGRKPPIELEKGFGLKKSEPIEINGHKLIGYIDRIDEKDGEYFITDYKTDRLSPERDSFLLHRNIQFTLYSYVFRKLFGKKEKAILYYHLRSNKVFKTYRSEKDYDYLKKTLDKVSEGISKDIFVPFYGFHCNMCDFKIACENYSIPYHGGPKINLEGKIKNAEEFRGWDNYELPYWMEEESEE